MKNRAKIVQCELGIRIAGVLGQMRERVEAGGATQGGHQTPERERERERREEHRRTGRDFFLFLREWLTINYVKKCVHFFTNVKITSFFYVTLSVKQPNFCS